MHQAHFPLKGTEIIHTVCDNTVDAWQPNIHDLPTESLAVCGSSICTDRATREFFNQEVEHALSSPISSSVGLQPVTNPSDENFPKRSKKNASLHACSKPQEPADSAVTETRAPANSEDKEEDAEDPATYVQKIDKLDAATRQRLILRGPFQPNAQKMEGKQFPKSRCGSHDRAFNENWYKITVGKTTFERKWLSYSPKTDAVFCHFCIFFGRNNREQVFTTTGYRDWKKAKEKFEKHEKSQSHIEATVDFSNFALSIPINVQLSNEAAKSETARQQNVKKNREIMKRLIDITLCLAQQGLAFRGHREFDKEPLCSDEEPEEETYTLGNFLTWVNLLAKYDAPLATHLKEVRYSKLKRKRKASEKIKRKSGRGNLVSFLSSDSQNKIINSIGAELLKCILDEIKEAGIYSIAMDCTTDSSHADQLSIIIRYLNRSLKIVERLVSIQRVKNSSAEGLFNTLQDILSKNSLSLKDAVGQSYDGASVMTGKYKGVKTLVQQVSPQCLFIWTFDHVLNLVIMEACSSSLAAKSLFGALEKLYSFFSHSRKRSDVLEEKQKESKIQQIHRPQRVSTTRWWSHQKALENVFFAQKESLFDCFIDTFEECQSTEQSPETITDAESLEQKFTSFQTVLTAHVFKQIFAITDPASLYLQSERIDLLTAIRLIETAESQLGQLREDFNKVLALAKTFCRNHGLHDDFVVKRARKKKRFPDELCNDEIEEDQTDRYRRETFMYAIDTAIASIRERFSSHKAILADFSLLDPERFQDINTSKLLPQDSFQNVAQNYGFDDTKLREEYMSFIQIYPKLKESEPCRCPPNENPQGGNHDLNRENYITVLKVLSTFNLQSAFPELYTVYKTLVTLPIGSTKCERAFSKLKFVKSHLRTTMGQQRLNSLMLINVEKELTKTLDYENVIDKFADTPLLRKLLRY